MIRVEKMEPGDDYLVFYNNKEIGTTNSKKGTWVEINYNGFELVKNLKFNEIPKQIEFLSIDPQLLQKKIDIYPLKIFSLYLSREEDIDKPDISSTLDVDFINWSFSITPYEFTNLLINKFEIEEEYTFGKEEDTDNRNTPFEFFLYKDIDFNLSIKENLELTFHKLKTFITELLDKKKDNENPQSLNSFFSFPEEYKIACEQYLLYFVTFLKDLGIEAKTDLENQENGVLFKVFPKDKEAALTQIKEALEVYLALPVQQNIEAAATQFTDAAVQQLVANVYHLKSQLMFANATITRIQENNKALELFQYQNQPIIQFNETINEQKNEEKIFGGIVTVKEYEGTGFNIDLPKLFRMMKRIWGK